MQEAEVLLRIYLLGPFKVELDGRLVSPDKWGRPKDRALLKLLALQSGHLVPQDQLVDQLWPDLTPSAGLNSLQVAVSRLRKLLGRAAVIRHAGVGYLLEPSDSVWIDIEEFRGSIDRGRDWRQRSNWAAATQAYRAAVALYRGDLCEEDPYAEWALQAREQMRQAFLSLVEELTDCLLHLRAPAEAIELGERGLTHDATREGLYVQLMRSHLAAGHVAEALQVYERCRRTLADELGVDPGPAARAVYEQLLRADESGVPSLSPAPTTLVKVSVAQQGGPTSAPTHDEVGRLHLPCVGRERELASLAARIAFVEQGQGQIVLLHGEPGIGKTRLLQESGRLAQSR